MLVGEGCTPDETFSGLLAFMRKVQLLVGEGCTLDGTFSGLLAFIRLVQLWVGEGCTPAETQSVIGFCQKGSIVGGRGVHP